MRQATNALPTKKGMSTIGEACLQQMAQLSRVRVLLADDFHLFLERASSLLEPAFEIVEKVGDGQSLFEAASIRIPMSSKQAWAAGALAYVAKSQLATDLLPAIREALAGRIFISSSI